MPTTTIPWGDGSGDNLYLTYPSASGDQSVSVTSDANTGAARSKVVTFSAVGVTPVTLTISQDAGASEQTLTANPSSYDAVNSVYRSIPSGYPLTNAYDGTSGNTSCHVVFANGAGTETKFYWKFDLSSIPVGATIVSVSLKAKAAASANVGGTAVAEQYLAVCNGTTEVGQHQGVTNTGTIYTLDAGTGWTRESLQNISILFYTRRGTSGTSSAYYQNFFGADLTITYTI